MRLITVDVGRCDDLPSWTVASWYDLGICYRFWADWRGEHPGVPHVCMSARAIPHQCVCIHQYRR